MRAVAAAGDAHDVDDDYLGHVRSTGALLVAVDASDAPVGFGGVVVVPTAAGPTAMVTDLFVDPGHRGGGVGTALLEALLAGHERRMTCSSKHPAALPAYRRAGLAPVGRLGYLRRAAGQRPYRGDGPSPDAASVREALAAHPSIGPAWVHGRDELVAHWGSLGALTGRDVVLGVETASDGSPIVVVRRLHAARADDAVAVVVDLLDRLPAGVAVEACVPDWTDLPERLSAVGFVEVDHDIVCTTPGVGLDPTLVVVSPGLW